MENIYQKMSNIVGQSAILGEDMQPRARLHGTAGVIIKEPHEDNESTLLIVNNNRTNLHHLYMFPYLILNVFYKCVYFAHMQIDRLCEIYIVNFVFVNSIATNELIMMQREILPVESLFQI
ncbi:hypothetical protein ACJX0J_019788 [Zea mays]